ncbi:phage portal protein [Pseudobacteriovorax antillogorgiicola]|uniref:Phage portal protein, lambda family n=1 Tax=Pseudobacteriovorax antillogorgiicola TaxID=1513793 RepID=A0A1Y6CPC5_9BACT|nr:phage portal protein [Pseudobacteriovorax antillogorgiicola]TCS44253.1 lambda family phage portal protein [Pseudobacteriovorax antillogorgiicola]SMF80759.1 phage portal protein, lambda family [Pseudobacteriovorax antillogorgiicola]
MNYEESPSGLLLPQSMSHSYKTANPFNRIVENWMPASGDTDEALLPSLEVLRDQSRDLDRNESIARGAIENITSNVVGEGLWPQAKLNHEILEISEKEARGFEARAENLFRLHAESTALDFTGRSTFPELLDQVLRSQFVDGDILGVRRVKEVRKHGLLATAVQLIPGARLTDPLDYQGRQDLREGVELDLNGEPIAYHILNRGKYLGDRYAELKTMRVPRYSKSDDIQVLHVFHRRMSDQTRGEPLLAPALEKFKQLSRYAEAEIAAAVINAFYTTFITTEGVSVLDQRSYANEYSAKAPKQERSRAKLGPMTMLNLLPGEKVESPTPGRPSPQFEAFFQSVLKQIGPSIGLPYEVLLQHFSASYSAARASLLQAWRFFKIRRKWLEIQFCQPVYEWVIEEAILKGLLDAPGFEDPLKRATYLKATWIGQEMPSIDRLKDAKADEVELANGTTTRREIVESKGKDYDKIGIETAKDSAHSERLD